VTALHPDPTKPLRPEQSLGELFGEMSREFTGLLDTHVELAKVEVREEVRGVTQSVSMFGAAAASGALAVLLLSFAAAWGLAVVMPTGFAFLIVGAVWAVVAGVLALSGRARMAKIEKPDDTIAVVKEDVEWARQKRS